MLVIIAVMIKVMGNWNENSKERPHSWNGEMTDDVVSQPDRNIWELIVKINILVSNN